MWTLCYYSILLYNVWTICGLELVVVDNRGITFLLIWTIVYRSHLKSVYCVCIRSYEC
jgi:hypothetical protein